MFQAGGSTQPCHVLPVAKDRKELNTGVDSEGH